MAKEVQLRRGTTAQHAAFTGKEGEVTVDTTAHRLVVHDGTTAGGHAAPTKAEVDAQLAEITPLLGDGAAMTLIETVTVPTGGVNEYVRTQTPGAIAYRLKAAMVEIVTTAGGGAVNAYVFARYGGASGTSIGSPIVAAINTAARWSRFRFSLNHGIWRAHVCSTIAAGGTGVNYEYVMTPTLSDAPYIDYIRIVGEGGGLFPTGTVIKILGVQDNA